MLMKRWKTLEAALMHYAVIGVACFPVFGPRPDRIGEDEVLRLVNAGFGEILEKNTGGTT